MPYLCNVGYVMFGAFGVPPFREHLQKWDSRSLKERECILYHSDK